MRRARPRLLLLLLPVLAILAACGSSSGSSSAAGTVSTSESAAAVPAAAAGGAELTVWPEFGLDPQRSDATNASAGITAANIGSLRDHRVTLPGTIDSSPIYLGSAKVAGGTHDVAIMTSSYGRTFALDAGSGKRLWTYTPPGYSNLLGSAQITTTSPLLDPEAGRRYVYTASPDGKIHKLLTASGKEVRSGAWPVTITRDPTKEKMAAALNVDGPYVIAATGGYIGDAPDYQGHVVLIDRDSGKVAAVFNTLCADRRSIIVPSSCPESDSAVLSRGGAVVEPGGRSLLVDTGNATWDGRRYFGDSVLELSVPGLRRLQSYTPRNQAELNSNDLDLGSSAPALLGQNRVLVGGKDGVLRVLDLKRLDGHAPGGKARLGGEVQTLETPGNTQLFTAPAVWHHGKATTVFLADSAATAAYALRNGRLHQLWQNDTPGTSPIVAGGLVYVYEPGEGGIEVYQPNSANPIAKLPGASGHWNSPIVVDGHVIEPEGDANDHSGEGTVDLLSLP
ncbi:MAG: PQQ-binding-like beta-propeller repeat protein [Actinobacteria bacterium]|nr:PQQ-binding-like beta-propeller repeat protein [Actinomycetota bacterium]